MSRPKGNENDAKHRNPNNTDKTDNTLTMHHRKKRWNVPVAPAATLAFAAVALSLLFLLGAPAFANYEEQIHEGIFLVRPDNQYTPERTVPTYLSSEDLTFFACVEYQDTPVRLSLLCEDDNNFIDVEPYRWGESNCYIGSVNLDDFPCYNAIITGDYVHNGENLRLTKDIKINTVTGALQRVLDGQYADGGWSNALDTAYALFSLKPFQVVFNESVSGGLYYLKDNREDRNKCWPEKQCQISTTASVAYLLSQAGYEDDLRIIHDASIYLEKYMSYIESGETWNITFGDLLANYNNTVNTSCVFGYDSSNTTFELSKYPVNTSYTFTPDYGSILRGVCTESVSVRLDSTVRGDFLHYEGNNFSYVIPGPCWTFNNENVTCDLRATAFAIGTPIDEDRRDAAADYLETRLHTTVEGTRLDDDDLLNTAVYLHDAGDALSDDQRDDILRYLLYRQTNDGSWNGTRMHYNATFYEPDQSERDNLSHVVNDNVTHTIIYTGYVVQALLNESFTRDDEPVLDAERWLSLHENDVTVKLDDDDATDVDIVAAYDENVSDIQADMKRNGMSLFVLQQNTRPFLKSSDRIIILDRENLSIDITNPTTFALEGLTYRFGSSLAPYLDVDEKEYFAPYSFRRLIIRQLANDTPDTFGYLRIMQGGDEYAKIPIILESYPVLTLSIPQMITVFGTSTVVKIGVNKSSHDFSCSLNWKDGGISAPTSFTVERDGTFNLPVQFSQPATEEKDYSGVITCGARSTTFTFPFTLRVTRFITKPLAISPSALSATTSEQELSFTLKNLLDESIDVTLSLANATVSMEFSDYILNLYPGETQNVTVYITTSPGENVSEENTILIKTFNLEERIPISVDVEYLPEEKLPLSYVIGGSIFGVGLFALLAYFAYTNRKRLYELYKKRFKKESEYQKALLSVQEYEQKEEALAVKNMMQILKMQGVGDKDIRKRLVEEGFTEQEITAALKTKTEEETKPAVPGAAPRK